jgi:hypothetical protein
MNKKTIILILVLVIAVGAGVLWYADNYVKKLVINNNGNGDKTNGDKTEEIDTSGWQTYRNEEYGFEVKYPEDFDMELPPENSSTIIEIHKLLKYTEFNGSKIVEDLLSLSVRKVNNDLTLEGYVNWLNNSDPMFPKVENQSEYIIDNVAVKKLSGSRAENIGKNDIHDIFIRRNNKSYVIRYNHEDSAIQNKILSTFKFIK